MFSLLHTPHASALEVALLGQRALAYHELKQPDKATDDVNYAISLRPDGIQTYKENYAN